MKKKAKRRMWLAIEIVCLVVFAAMLGIITMRVLDTRDRVAEQKEARKSLEEIIASIPKTCPTVSTPEMFDTARELYAQNPDFVGMVGFDDMALYICRGSDNIYYASHRFDHTEDDAGMIHMDYRCSVYPMSYNTILYGHNMRDGSRFGKLKRFAQAAYVKANPEIKLATLYELATYEVFAVFYASIDPQSDLYFDFTPLSFSTLTAFEDYIHEIKKRSVVTLSRTPALGETLLTLVTCAEGDGNRLVVVAVRKDSAE